MSDNKFKYYCEKCDLGCNIISRWESHIKTEKHLIGQRKKRSDYKEPYKCNKCEYETKNITTMKMHKLNSHSNKEERDVTFEPCSTPPRSWPKMARWAPSGLRRTLTGGSSGRRCSRPTSRRASVRWKAMKEFDVVRQRMKR